MMRKPDSCPVCGQPIQEEQPRFYFPKLPAWHALRKYYGTAHIDCLQTLPDRDAVSKALADMYERFHDSDSATPVVVRERNLVIKDCRRGSACLELYDFDDFAEFDVPMHALEAVQQLAPAHCLRLGVQGLQVLHRAADGTLSLESTKPHFVVDLPGMTHESLVRCLTRAKKTRSSGAGEVQN